MVVVGGVILKPDFKPLRDAGVDGIFPPCTVIAEAALNPREQLHQRIGYTRRGRLEGSERAPRFSVVRA